MKKHAMDKRYNCKNLHGKKMRHEKLSFQGNFNAFSSGWAGYIFLQCSFAIPFYFKAYIH